MMHPRITLTALAVAAVFSVPSHASADDEAAVVVTATRTTTPEATATFAAEIHTRKQIERSGASSLLDYLSNNTSLTILPNYGSRATPLLDLRGYGIGGGHQNVVITIDGVRQNTIDLAPVLLAGISLTNIDRIEITKGSGSVAFGDGAVAGSVAIFTKRHSGTTATASAGNYGAQSTAVSLGKHSDGLSLDANLSRDQLGGYNHPDARGHKDASVSDNWSTRATLRPNELVAFKLGADGSRVNTRYVSAMSQAQLDLDPRKAPSGNYTQQDLTSDRWNAGVEFWATPEIKASADHTNDKRMSAFPGWISDYEYNRSDVSARGAHSSHQWIVGAQLDEGTRSQPGNATSKDNRAVFAQYDRQWGDAKLSAGLRRESVRYVYSPSASAALEAKHSETAWDIGANLRVNETTRLFTNLNHSFRMPDIDRFFRTDFTTFVTSFNGFIEPMEVNTLNVGMHHITDRSQTKATLFGAKLKNEIFYSPASFENTNIDKSHKLGLEIDHTWKINSSTSLMSAYQFTKAIIDSENDGGGAYNGKELPGVSRHAGRLGLNVRPDVASTLTITHVWRGTAYAMNDFANTATQKQRPFISTNVSYRRKVDASLDVFAAVDNLFARTNGIWVADDFIYPVNHTRNWRLGLSARF